MTGPTKIDWRARLWLFGSALALAAIVLTGAPPAAQARVWVSVGGPCCGYWGPGPYDAYPPPAYYPPPPSYYAPPPGYYSPAPGAAASAYTPEAASAYAPAGPGAPAMGLPAAAAPANPGSPPITYTSKPPFTNSAGQTCREYRASASGRDVFGTACQEADGQWRVVN